MSEREVAIKACVLIPIYNHGATIGGVIEALAPAGLPCFIIDDGSDHATRAALREIAALYDWVQVHHRPQRGGKGAALKTGYRLAAERGFTHAVQLDADGQHAAGDVVRFVASMRQHPDALILGTPVFDASVSKLRLCTRQLSRCFVWLATLSFAIRDPLCGFRGIPLQPMLALLARVRTGNWMDFEPENAVRLFREGVPIVNLPTRVVYHRGGISHFDVVRDDLRLSWLYTRLCVGLLLRPCARWLRRFNLSSEQRTQLSHQTATAGAHLLDPTTHSGEKGALAAAKSEWVRMAESGSILALRAMARFYRFCGRRASLVLLYPVAAYFFLRDGAARRASRNYLAVLYACPEGRARFRRSPDWRDSFRQFYEFAINIFDRMVGWGGAVDTLPFRQRGSEQLFELIRERRGAVLVGSHVGSFDMLRLIGDRYRLHVNVLMFTRHAERINRFFAELDPNSNVRVIELDPHSVRTAFAIKECIDRGELVGILADRTDPSGRGHPVQTTFLGRPAHFPLSPFLLAVTLRCPLIFSICGRGPDGAYEAIAESLWSGEIVPRREREKRARELLEAYVRLLEYHCVRTPYQWFNFYDFWAPPTGTGVLERALDA